MSVHPARNAWEWHYTAFSTHIKMEAGQICNQ